MSLMLILFALVTLSLLLHILWKMINKYLIIIIILGFSLYKARHLFRLLYQGVERDTCTLLLSQLIMTNALKASAGIPNPSFRIGLPLKWVLRANG